MKKDHVDNVNWSNAKFYNANNLRTMDLRIGRDKQNLLSTLSNNPDFCVYKIKCCLKYYHLLDLEICDRQETVWHPYKHIKCLIPEKAFLNALHNANRNILHEVTTNFARLAIK